MVTQFATPGIKMAGTALPNIPWENRPAGSNAVLWRYSGNPIIERHATPTSNSIFNSAAVAHQGQFAGVFRVDDTRRIMTLHVGRSANGVNWQIEPQPIEWQFND